jgi:hypothetical protein
MAVTQQRAATSRSAAPPLVQQKPQRVSMNPETFTAGGLINDIDVTITQAGTTVWDMNGAVDPSTPFLAVEFTDDNGAAHQQYYSAGKPEDWEPDDEQAGFISKSGKTSINSGTNLGMFIASLVEFGFPKELLDEGDLRVIAGTRCHVIQKALERQGLVRTGKNASRPSTVLLVSKIHELPGNGAGKPSASAKPTIGKAATTTTTKAAGGKPNGAAAHTTAAAATDEMDDDIVNALRAGLPSDGTPVAIKEVPKIVYQYFNDNGMKGKPANDAVAKVNKQSFKQGLVELGFVYDGSTLALATE